MHDPGGFQHRPDGTALAELVQLVAEDTPQADIAEIMGYANADSVKVTLNRIRKKIKDGAADAGLSPYWQRHPSPY